MAKEGGIFWWKHKWWQSSKTLESFQNELKPILWWSRAAGVQVSTAIVDMNLKRSLGDWRKHKVVSSVVQCCLLFTYSYNPNISKLSKDNYSEPFDLCNLFQASMSHRTNAGLNRTWATFVGWRKTITMNKLDIHTVDGRNPAPPGIKPCT